MIKLLLLHDVSLLGTCLSIKEGTEVWATRATNQPNTSQWFIRPTDGVWAGLDVNEEDSILIADRDIEISGTLGFRLNDTESRIPELLPLTSVDTSTVVEWTEDLAGIGLTMHPDDDPADAIREDGKPLYSADEAAEMRRILDWLAELDWLDLYADTAMAYMHRQEHYFRTMDPAHSTDEADRLLRPYKHRPPTDGWGPLPSEEGLYWMWSGLPDDQPPMIEAVDEGSVPLSIYLALVQTNAELDSNQLEGKFFSRVKMWPPLVVPNP